MRITEFVEAMQAIESERMISKEIVISALSDALVKAYRKQIEIPDALVRVQLDTATGDLTLYHQHKIVETVEDDELDLFCKIIYKHMIVENTKRNPWLRVPLAIEIAASPVGGSWADVEPIDTSHLF